LISNITSIIDNLATSNDGDFSPYGMAGPRNTQPHPELKKPTTAKQLDICSSISKDQAVASAATSSLYLRVSALDSVFRHSRFVPGAAVYAFASRDDVSTV
jgi:hypothetical protein